MGRTSAWFVTDGCATSLVEVGKLPSTSKSTRNTATCCVKTCWKDGMNSASHHSSGIERIGPSKKGELPPELIRKATPQLVQRTVQSVAEDYRRAVRRGDKREAQRCLQQIEEFPASVEKARAMVAPTLASRAVPELLAVTGLGEDADAKRGAVQAVLERNTGGTELPDDWAFSITWFLDEHGSPTEYRLVERYMEKCADRLRDLAQNPASIDRVALILWKCARSRRIVGELRREIAMLMDLLVRTRNRDGFWKECLDGSPTPAVRTTALSTVVIQRLGDDRYHELLRANVQWLLGQVQAETGSLPRYADGTEPDLLATTFGLEALRRSDLAGELSHVLTRGDAWVVSAQTATGGWTGGSWDGDFVTATVLAYLARANDVLPQVDGFLLMARDFFRRGEDLRLEGGANNRRLSAIAVVHAVEMFLYGLFEKREDLGLSAYQDNGIETLGARKALGALQRALQRKGRLTENQRLPLRDQLSSLIGRRDGIIHRAHEISERELDTGIGHAREFIERQGDELLELNILE